MKVEVKVWDKFGVPKLMYESGNIDEIDLKELIRFIKRKFKRDKHSGEMK